MNRHWVRPLAPRIAVTQCALGDSFAAAAGTPHLAFCYRERLDPLRLREALARVFDDFPVYAGRLAERHGAFSIRSAGAGARFELAESAHTSASLGAAAHARSSELVCPQLSVARALRGRAPLFAARLTQTSDGSVLGVTWLHMVGDTHSAMLLLRAWALAYRGEPYEKPVAVSDRDAYLNEHFEQRTAEPSGLRKRSWRELGSLIGYFVTHPARRIQLEFSWDELAGMRAFASRERAVTTNDALSAHLFATIRRLEHRPTGAQLALSINYRKRLGLPENLLGNLVDLVGTRVSPGDDAASIAHGLRSAIEAFTSGPLGHPGLMTLKASRPARTELMRYAVDYLDPRGGNLMLTSWTNFGIYRLAFGATAPVYVHCRNSEKVLLSWFGCVFESPADAGLRATLWLPSKLARALQRELQRPLVSTARDNLAEARAC